MDGLPPITKTNPNDWNLVGLTVIPQDLVSPFSNPTKFLMKENLKIMIGE